MNYIFETNRLYFRNWVKSDKPIFASMNKDPDVMKYFPSVLNENESNRLVDRIERQIKEKEYGLWAVEAKDKNQFIGFIGFNYKDFASDFTPCIEIGWRLIKEYWGKGYATEGAVRCLNYGFKKLLFNEVFSFTAIINKRSEKVMRNIGMEKIKEFNHPKIESSHILSLHVLYRVTREEYEQR